MELLERDPFISALNRRFEQTLVGEGHTFFIIGEAGIGKSSLVRHFLRKIESRSRVLTALCDHLFTPRPLGPLYELAFQMHLDISEQLLPIPMRSALFSRILYELTDQPKPVVLVIEDIHWADEATLDFIKFLSRRIQHTRCLLLLTYRDDEITGQHPLRTVLGELSAETFTRLLLPPLSRETVQRLARERGYDGEDVYEITGGNPFYVSEILASYSPGIPENVKDSILSVYNRLPDTTREAWQLLSVVPEGLEYGWMNSIDLKYQEAIEDCMAHGIILVRNNRTVFKHELFRRTVESSMSPFKRQQLNKKILNLFLPMFESAGSIERIVHYARNAGDNQLVAKYAPVAARQAASVGAHLQAARLYLVAIEYSGQLASGQLVQLYEDYTYECYLTHQISEAIIFQTKALRIWEEQELPEKIGNSYRFLSRLWWFNGQREEAEKFGLKAVEIFASQPTGKGKAMAYSNMSQLTMLAEQREECIYWSNLAIQMAHDIQDEEILCHALNNVGTVKWKEADLHEEGKKQLSESLCLALKHGFHEHAARAYTNLICNLIGEKQYEPATSYLVEALRYCEERDLHSWSRYLFSWRARLLLETGQWKQALTLAESLQALPGQSAIIQLGALIVQATIQMRAGKAGSADLLYKARQMAFKTREHARILPVINACLEYEWLRGTRIIQEDEWELTLLLIGKVSNMELNREAVFWMHRAGRLNKEMSTAEWQLKGAQFAENAFPKAAAGSYEQALCLFEGTAEDKIKALAMLQKLGAMFVWDKLRQEMRSSGMKHIPRGIRATTQANLALLTSREMDILHLLQTGAQNKDIATTLFISPKTVDHHISSILFKLDVGSRVKAVKEAEKLGILK